MKTHVAPALVLLAVALALGGCGGGDETSPHSSPAEGGMPGVAPLEVSGGGSAQFRVKGGDNSIQDYGEEAPRDELRRAARVVHGYLVALAREDWGAACSRFSRRQSRGLERIAAAASPQLGGCAAALAKLIGRVAPAAGREATVVDAASLRMGGAQGFLIYRGDRGKPYFMSLRREAGGWTVAGLSPVALP